MGSTCPLNKQGCWLPDFLSSPVGQGFLWVPAFLRAERRLLPRPLKSCSWWKPPPFPARPQRGRWGAGGVPGQRYAVLTLLLFVLQPGHPSSSRRPSEWHWASIPAIARAGR